MVPSTEVWAVIIVLGLALIGASVALWFYARRELSAERRPAKHRDDDPGAASDPSTDGTAPPGLHGRHALRDPNAALAGILSQVPPRPAPGGQHRAD